MDDTDKALVVLAGKDLPGPCLRASSGCKCRERFHKPGPFRYWCMCCWKSNNWDSNEIQGAADVPKTYNCDGSLRDA